MEYNPEWDLRALMLSQLEQIPYVKDLVARSQMHVEQSLSFLRLQYCVLFLSPYLFDRTILPQRLQVNSSAMGQAGWMPDKNGTQLLDQGRRMKMPSHLTLRYLY